MVDIIPLLFSLSLSLSLTHTHTHTHTQFTDNLGNTYTVTLCGSLGKIVQNSKDKSINLGSFQAMVVSSTTNGPRLLYSHGDSCPNGNSVLL